MESEALVETLQEAGLSPYQAEAYVAVLELGTASATEVAEHSDVPKPRIYDVLDGLEDAGYVETYEQGSQHVRAHSPAEVLDDLRDRAARFEAAADEVEARWEQPELASNEASIVKRFQTVVEQAETFVDGAAYQVQLSVTPDDYERLRPRLREAHDRGVSVRVSLHTRPDESPPPVEAFEGVCLEVRHRRLPAPFVALIDREKTCFAHHPDSYDQYGVLVNDRTHTYIFHWYFLTCLWDHWEPIYTAQGEELPVEYVDIRHFVREVRPLLADGATVRARIEGHDLATGRERVVAGTVREAVSAGGGPDADGTLAGQVAVVLDTPEGEVTVGGWGAMLEEIEATRITVCDVTHPTSDPTELLFGDAPLDD